MYKLKALICPSCSKLKEYPLTLGADGWLICENMDCYQRYQVIDNIPRILTKSGDFFNSKDIEEYAPTYRNFKTST